MGRHAGFIACYAALANHHADFVLIPEVPFALDGESGFLAALERRVAERGSAVVVVAEGAGQDLMSDEQTGTTPPATASSATSAGSWRPRSSGTTRPSTAN